MKSATMRQMLAVIVVTGSSAMPLAGQSPQETFQRALTMERSAGKLDSAIVLYRHVISNASTSRALAARSLIRLGSAFEVLGRTEARAAYERVVRDFGDQSEMAAQARQRLAALSAPPGARRSQSARQAWSGIRETAVGLPSPNGRYAPYVDGATGNLGVHDLVTGSDRLLTKDGSWGDPLSFAETFAFSRDSRQIAYSWWTNRGPGNPGGYELRTIGLDGGEPHIVAKLGYLEPFGWTPKADGILAAVMSPSGDDDFLAIVRLNGEMQRIKTLDWRWPFAPSLSPDGRWVVYDATPGDGLGRDVFIVATDGSQQRTLVENPANDWHPMWAPDGRSVVFFSDRSGGSRAWQIDVADGLASGAPRPLSVDLGQSRPLGFTQDGGLWYFPNAKQSDIAVATVDSISARVTQQPTVITNHLAGSNRMPDWSPDGSAVAYKAMRGLTVGLPDALVIQNRDGSNMREVTPPLRVFAWPRWSPDGRGILLSGNQRDRASGLFRIDAATGAMTVIHLTDKRGEAGDPHADWAADGRSIFYLSEDSAKQVAINRFDIATGRAETLYRNPATRPVLGMAASPDGRWLAFTASVGVDDFRTRLLSLSDGSVRDVSATMRYWSINWMPDSRSFLGIGATNARSSTGELWRVPIDGSVGERIPIAARGFTMLRLSRAGRHLAFVTPTTSEMGGQLWVMENLLSRSP